MLEGVIRKMTGIGFREGSLIEVPSGQIPIENLTAGQEIVTPWGNRKVINISSESVDNLIEVNAGSVLLYVSPEQMIATYRLNQSFEVEYEWLKAKDILPERFLAIYSKPFPNVGWYDAKCISIENIVGDYLVYIIQVEDEALVVNDILMRDCSPAWQ